MLIEGSGAETRETYYAAFFTLPERMQDVQTFNRRVAPLTRARTFCRLRFQTRLVILWAWLMRCPD